MKSAHLFSYLARGSAACVVLALSACASEALNNQLANTQEAVDQARIAGAADKAPADFSTAVDKLNQAKTAANTRHKDDAMRLAQEAQVDANLARARTDSVQARVAATELTKSNQILREALAQSRSNRGER
jgi:hypothetical protein